MKIKRLAVPLFTIVFLFHQLFVVDAYAYLDPGSGSAIIAMIVSALAGIGMTLKLYWLKIKEKFSKKNNLQQKD